MRKQIKLQMTLSDNDESAAYIYLTHEQTKSKRTIVVSTETETGAHSGTIVLDIDKEGRLLGIEVLNAQRVLSPSLLNAFHSDER